MKSTQRSLIRRATMVAAAGAVGVLGLSGTAVADSSPPASWHSTGASWNDPNDKGGRSVYEQGSKLTNNEDIMGQFIAFGETLTIFDRHNNGHPAIVKLWVGGSGPAVFYGDGDGTTTEIPLSYDEGQTVKLEVCTSDSAKAYCTTDTASGVS